MDKISSDGDIQFYRVILSLEAPNYCLYKLCYWDNDLKIYIHIQTVTTEVYLQIIDEYVNQLTDDELTTGYYQQDISSLGPLATESVCIKLYEITEENVGLQALHYFPRSSYSAPNSLFCLQDCLYRWHFNRSFHTCTYGVRGGAVGWGTALQAGRSRVQFPMVSLDFFHWHNPAGRTMALGLTQPLTEMSTRNVSWG